MREILFRGKRDDDGEWIYGSLLIETIQPDSGAEYKSYKISDITLGEFPNDFMSGWEDPVDPETVGQYTGLTDKNGVKIFEGDICDFSVFDFNDHDTQYRGIVVYSGSRFMLWKSVKSEYYGADGGFDLDWVIGQDDEFEVIGNIHDNPELLKEE